ncbi:MAG: transposase [Candidatus Daviesbacteria bacterium]|nr:transposase [Candidatus Daviesbacteria bacterium]
MPAKNSIKIYCENSYYHIYNRGVEKRLIFLDEQDYKVFLSYLRDYLVPKDEKGLRNILSSPTSNYKEKAQALKLIRLNNFADEIILVSYCLMPNHIHFLIKQISSNSIDRFMNSLCVRYTMYFNRKYKRVGSLYQDVYKAVLIENDSQLLHLSKYIHQNPLKKLPKSKLASQGDVLRGYYMQPSSLPEYDGQRQTEWVHPEEILGFFSKENPQLSYQAFVEQTEDLPLIENLVLDS